MIRLDPQAFSALYGKNIIVYGTGIMAKRYIPYLVQDPSIRLCGITNSRVMAEDEGTFLDTGLPLRSLRKWKELLPDATIFLMGFTASEEIIANCKSAGFTSFQFITVEMVSAALPRCERQKYWNIFAWRMNFMMRIRPRFLNSNRVIGERLWRWLEQARH